MRRATPLRRTGTYSLCEKDGPGSAAHQFAPLMLRRAETRGSIPAARSRPSAACISAPKVRGRRECRVLSRTRGPVCGLKKAYERSHHRFAETTGTPRANGFNGFLRALPGDRAFLSPSPEDHPTDLTPASRRQIG